jgi:ATP-binding cassette subfamily F protein uup
MVFVMPLVSLTHVSVAFGQDALLDNSDLQISAAERICLIGRNGVGKSTLLNIIADELQPDAGDVWRQPGLQIALLSQGLPADSDATVFEIVAGGLQPLGELLTQYHNTAMQLARSDSPAELKRIEHLQQELEAQDGWNLTQRVETTLTRLQLPADTKLRELSGGWRRRAMLGRALVSNPDLLLLDEPTNHLDIDAIQWLEEQLLDYRGGLLFVTHDRALLRHLATRIIELDRGQLSSWPGDYDRYLERKAAALEVEERHHAKFDKQLAQEEVWMRQGIKARRTRNEGRVRALKALREKRRQRREQLGNARLQWNDAGLSGQLVIEAENLQYHWQETPLIQDFSVRILRGDRIGLIGPNGSGKTTLLNLLLGRLIPQAGRLRLGAQVQVAYFDQLREPLELDKSVLENVAEGREVITINGKNVHIISYLGNFLFTPERARGPVRSLSGGERNRVLLARLFSQPANLLVLDEPTNDLDMETLELLEDLLMDYTGTLLLVSHDRAFLDNVVTSCLVFEGAGRISEYVGGYSDWLRQRPTPEPVTKAKPESKAKESKPRSSRTSARLSYKEQRELAQLPEHIEQLEAEQNELQETASHPEFYRRDPETVSQLLNRLKRLEQDLETAYQRWDELEKLRASV